LPSSLRRFFCHFDKSPHEPGQCPERQRYRHHRHKKRPEDNEHDVEERYDGEVKAAMTLKAVGLVEALNAQRVAVTTAPTT
jgi:hypothetical protein